MTDQAESPTTEDAAPARPSARHAIAGAVRAALRLWRYLYGENPLHLLSVVGCFALSGYVVSMLWDDPSLIALGVWFAGAVLGHDLLLYPLYALADQPLVAGRWLRRRALPRHPPPVPAINHVRVPFLGSMVLGLVWFPSITARGAEAFAFTAGHPMVGQYENWLLITGALFVGSAVVYALRLGAAAGRGVVGLVRSRSATGSTGPTGPTAPAEAPTEAFPATVAAAAPTEAFVAPTAPVALPNGATSNGATSNGATSNGATGEERSGNGTDDAEEPHAGSPRTEEPVDEPTTDAAPADEAPDEPPGDAVGGRSS